MTQRPYETNVRVPVCAAAALDVIAASNCTSRDGALRSLLVRYAERQRELSEDERLTHIATLLRYPLHRRKRGLLADPEVKLVPLRLRADRRVIEEARALAFRLPGQPPRRGHEDYQARPMTDVVMTAIAHEQLFEDAFLAGMLPVIRHRAALELWHLVVELTRTRAEREGLAGGSGSRRARRTAELLGDEEEAWHHEQRLVVLRRFARQALSGQSAAVHEAELQRGRRPPSLKQNLQLDIEELGLDLREARDDYEHELIGEVGSDWRPVGREGRGGTAVWRASHRAALEDIPEWLANNARAPLVIEKGDEGWSLESPDCWQGLVRYTREVELPASWAEHVAAGRLLELEYRRWRVLWPILANEEPVPRLAIALAACRGTVTPAQRVELLLMEHWLPVRLRPRQAAEWGLLTASEADEVVAHAVALTKRRMLEAIEQAERVGLEPDAVSELKAAKRSYGSFVRVCARRGIEFDHRHDSRWLWAAPSLAVAACDSKLPDDALLWLGEARVKSWQRRLWQAEQSAWHRAIERFRHPRRSR